MPFSKKNSIRTTVLLSIGFIVTAFVLYVVYEIFSTSIFNYTTKTVLILLMVAFWTSCITPVRYVWNSFYGKRNGTNSADVDKRP